MTIKQAFLADYMTTMSNEQLGQLVRLMQHMDTVREMLPIGQAECQHLAGATTRDQHRELDRLLAAHFSITELGRVPATLALRVSRQDLLRPATEGATTSRHRDVHVTSHRDVKEELDVTRRASNKLRQKHNRARKEPMIAELRDRGAHIGKNPSLALLKQLLDVTPRRHDDVTVPLRPRDSRAVDRDLEEIKALIPIPGSDVTPAEAAAAALRRLGIADCSAGHPVLLQLLRGGITIAELEDAGRTAVEKAHNGGQFAYALKVAETRRRQAASLGDMPAKPDFMDKWGVRK